MFRKYNKSQQQLVAHCFFSAGQVEYNNYEQYYQNQEEQHIIDQIEADADY